MADTWISPNFKKETLSTGDIEGKIDVFEDQIRISLLNQAEALFNVNNPSRNHAGKAVLMILLPYFETIAQFRLGASSNGKSREFFKQEFLRAFSLLSSEDPTQPAAPKLADDIAYSIYSQVRCGLLHSSAIKNKVVLSNRWPVPIRVSTDRTTADVMEIEIHPEVFLKHISRTIFPAYLAELRDVRNTDLRTKFEQFFDSGA